MHIIVDRHPNPNDHHLHVIHTNQLLCTPLGPVVNAKHCALVLVGLKPVELRVLA
ncbi:hypothetical protein [Malonomonas rubra]|uniref:hypothetical protein n=1 Tax=Malonomonas rubra TaxID=57040 RepID=UPI0026EA4B68|nr:hypothetical protein [Malonomonas rubra]